MALVNKGWFTIGAPFGQEMAVAKFAILAGDLHNQEVASCQEASLIRRMSARRIPNREQKNP